MSFRYRGFHTLTAVFVNVLYPYYQCVKKVLNILNNFFLDAQKVKDRKKDGS